MNLRSWKLDLPTRQGLIAVLPQAAADRLRDTGVQSPNAGRLFLRPRRTGSFAHDK